MAYKVTRHDRPTEGGVEAVELEPPANGYEYVRHTTEGNDLIVVWEHDGGAADVSDQLEELTEAVGSLQVVCKSDDVESGTSEVEK